MAQARSSAEDFIRAWQGAETVAEVAEKLGIKAETARARALGYVAKGIQLKKLSGTRGHKLDLGALTQLAAETLPEGAEVMAPRDKKSGE